MSEIFGMSDVYKSLQQELRSRPATWLVTGAAGFIGSHLVENLLLLGQKVRGLDNFSTGYQANLDHVRQIVGEELWSNFSFRKGDVRDSSDCRNSVDGVDYVLHQAALGSVPRSIEEPFISHDSNVSGFLTLLDTARLAGCKRFVYASSSSVYGDEPTLPKREELIGTPLSPYAVTKLVDELYANCYSDCYGTCVTGLRYFNVFGPRQDPQGAYAAVIPAWTDVLARGGQTFVNGDGETSRDFCFIANVVQANLLAAAVVNNLRAPKEVFNVAVGERTTLNDLHQEIVRAIVASGRSVGYLEPEHRDFRPGDVRHSLADIALISEKLGFSPTHRLADGLVSTVKWFLR
ncbi:MAG: SDR family oxidoreductase [bacterium]|nr:SDR family oxidoreductase [bacterium]